MASPDAKAAVFNKTKRILAIHYASTDAAGNRFWCKDFDPTCPSCQAKQVIELLSELEKELCP